MSIALGFKCNLFRHFFFTSDNHYILVATFDFCNSPWKYYFGDTLESKVFAKREEYFGAISGGSPSSLLLNSDKSVRAFGHKAEEQYHRILQKGPTDYYFFKQISRLYESEKVSNFLQTIFQFFYL